MSKFIDMTGVVFGRLKVIARAPSGKRYRTRWRCLCDCGSEVEVYSSSLQQGLTASCGCLRVDVTRAQMTTHGMFGTPEYWAWSSMWDRTTNPKNRKYPTYKDRAPPQAWATFENFYRDMGPRPGKGYSIERSDNDKPYGPNNCVWATLETQANNKATTLWVVLAGERMSLAKACRKLGLNYSWIHGRYRVCGWTMLKASGGNFNTFKE